MKSWNYKIFCVSLASLLRGGAFYLHKNTTMLLNKVKVYKICAESLAMSNFILNTHTHTLNFTPYNQQLTKFL
jgi:hypothetical protein